MTWLKTNGELETIDFEKKLTVSKVNIDVAPYIGMHTIGDFSLDVLIMANYDNRLVHSYIVPRMET